MQAILTSLTLASLCQIDFRAPSVNLVPVSASSAAQPNGFIDADGAWLAYSLRHGAPSDRARLRVFNFAGEEWEEVSDILWPPVADPSSFAVRFDLSGQIMAAGYYGSIGEVFIVDLARRSPSTPIVEIIQPPTSVGLVFGQVLQLGPECFTTSALRYVGEPHVNSGIVYLYERVGGHFHLTAEITAPAADQSHGNLRFGNSLSREGDTLLVGARNSRVVNGVLEQRVGSVYVYRRDGQGSWNLIQRVDNPSPERNADFGEEIDQDGDTFVVGRPGTPSSTVPGSAFIYEKSPSGTYYLAREIAPSNGFSDQVGSDFFGVSVGIEDGLVAAGSRRGFNLDGQKLGNIALFHQGSDGSWPSQETAVLSVPSSNGSSLGSNLALSEGRVFSALSIASSPEFAPAYIFGATASRDLCPPSPSTGGAGLRIDFSHKEEIRSGDDLIYFSGATPGDTVLLLASLTPDLTGGIVFPAAGRTCLGGPVQVALTRTVFDGFGKNVFADQELTSSMRRMVRRHGSVAIQGLYRNPLGGAGTKLTNALLIDS